MGTVDEGASGACDGLRLERCPQCGYELRGLRADGLCPECGFAYSRDTIVMYGWSRNAPSSSPSDGFVLGWIVLAMQPVVISLLWLQRAVWWLFAASALMLAGLIVMRRRARRGCPFPHMLLVNPSGFGSRAGIGPVLVHPWHPDVKVEIHSVPSGRYRIKLTPPGRWSVRICYQVDMELETDPETAHKVAEAIRGWRNHTPHNS